MILIEVPDSLVRTYFISTFIPSNYDVYTSMENFLDIYPGSMKKKHLRDISNIVRDSISYLISNRILGLVYLIIPEELSRELNIKIF